jgi:hypothetical protein
MDARINRRGLLQAGAAGAVFAPLLAMSQASPAGAAPPVTAITTDVAILGGGAAGLHTA